MNVRPIAIWCVLFALLANAADGASFAVGGTLGRVVTVCQTQSMIAALDGDTSCDVSVYDFQRALETRKGEEPPASPEGDMAPHATLAGGPLDFSTQGFAPLPLGKALYVNRSLTPLGDTPVEPVSGLLASLTPGNRFFYQIAPHAPPRIS